MPSSIPYKACTKDLKSVWGNPIKCLANLGCKLLKIILIWSFSEGWSIICEIFSLQREINEVTESSGLCLKAPKSLLETSMTVLNANCLKKFWARSSQVLQRDTSNEANQRCVAPVDPHFSHPSPLDRRDSLFIYEKINLFWNSQSRHLFYFYFKGKIK